MLLSLLADVVPPMAPPSTCAADEPPMWLGMVIGFLVITVVIGAIALWTPRSRKEWPDA